jgi:uncharacterized protein YaiE (UPF0345 family)
VATIPTQLTNVTVHTKANVYHGGGVISHTVILADGARKTLGLIRPGKYHFDTAAPERMELVAGECLVTLAGEATPQAYAVGQTFELPGSSGFDIEVRQGLCEYICTFLTQT